MEGKERLPFFITTRKEETMGIIKYILQRGKKRVYFDFVGLFEIIQQNAM